MSLTFSAPVLEDCAAADYGLLYLSYGGMMELPWTFTVATPAGGSYGNQETAWIFCPWAKNPSSFPMFAYPELA